MDSLEYQITRLKSLSLCQTSFIKKFTRDKLKAGHDLISKVKSIVEELSLHDQYMKQVEDIRNGIIQLQLERWLDEKHINQSPYIKELEKIQNDSNELDKNEDSMPQLLSSQCDSLKKELSEYSTAIALLKAELAQAHDKYNDYSKVVEEKNKHAKEIVLLSARLESSQEELSKVRSELATAQTSANCNQATTSQAQLALESHQAEIIKVNEQLKIKSQEAIMLQTKLEELQRSTEIEKHEMMEAMALEVESVEKSKDSEIADVQSKASQLETQLALSRHTNKTTVAALGLLQQQTNGLRQELNKISLDARAGTDNAVAAVSVLIKQDISKRVKSSEALLNTVQEKYRREQIERRRLHNMVQELKGNIRVFLRCRPPTAKEIDCGAFETTCVSFPEPQKVSVLNVEKNKGKTWEFDEVFGLESTQAQVFSEVSGLVTSMLDGFNVCIFAYGQTGSGKTWTMSGPPHDRGVNTRSLEELFVRSAARAAEIRDTFCVSVLEVYNEDIHDLLLEPGTSMEKLEIRQSERGNHVPGLTTVQVDCLQNVFDLLTIADRHRSQTATNMNEHSSRSHMILSVQVTSENLVTNTISRGKLNLVDLAGSERINKSGATGQALKEAQNINKSLSALGDVIAARVAKQAHIPFRNSTLTYLLQDSLSQDSKTLMIVCASPAPQSVEETFCSLNFASRVRSVELGRAVRNASVSAGGSIAPSPNKPTSGSSGSVSPSRPGQQALARSGSINSLFQASYSR